MQARYFAPRGDFRPQALAPFDLAQDKSARFGWESDETQGEIFDSFIGMGFDEFVVFGAIDHLGNGRIVGTGLCAGFEIEMPPLSGEDAKTAGGHGFAQDAAQTDVLGAEDAAAHEPGFVANMSCGTEIVDGRSHGQTGGVAGGMEQTTGTIAHIARPTKGEIYSQSIVVQSAPSRRIADVDVLGRSGNGVPHALLNAHGAGGIVDFEGVIGIFALQGCLGAVQSAGGFGQQIGAMQVGIEHATDEIVGAGIHQTNENTGDGHAHVDQTALFQRTLERGASLGG